MSKVNSQLAKVHDAMYTSLFDYKREFAFYHRWLKRFHAKRILEVGCGTGALAHFFAEAEYTYLGLDLSKEMLLVAQSHEPTMRFIQGDMRSISVSGKFDAVLITGKSFAYMTENKDALSTLRSVYNTLHNGGLLIFDNFHADRLFSDFKKKFVDETIKDGVYYKRTSYNSLNLEEGWTWNWDAEYEIRKDGKSKVFRNKSVLRAFTKDDLRLFLQLVGFTVLRITAHHGSIVCVARKIER